MAQPSSPRKNVPYTSVTTMYFYVVEEEESAASMLTTCALMLMSSMTLTVFIAGRFLGGEI